MKTTWLNDNEMRAWRVFVETTERLTVALEADLVEHGLTMGDYEVLVRLSESADHQLRMCDLAQVLQLSPSGLTRRLDGLVKSGAVVRVPSTTDRRVQLAELSPIGLAKLVETAPTHVASVRARLLDPLTPQQIDALYEIFAAVRGKLTSTNGCQE